MTSTDRNAVRQKAVRSVKAETADDVAAATPKRSGHILFVSSEEATVRFDIIVVGTRISPFWDEKREHLIWSVPVDLVERFSAHEFVVKGRIKKEK